ncbi:MAG: ribonuclease HI family protein [Candidatus Pacebacteria bacterium]|nr:ribonuclease HI family protein [Candidatus Paceibacterota bacterium]MDD3072257.1 ribonuclease HI family protein [Candidatus Paceibacterota bacterium]MDD3729134.1 ribonuclease HI family protein [Candidatus Paceibacterota bacterium]MDD4201214.1 ribonuclease HI family protein [Candidatus Paceibacterota bacterium]MDD4466862.1 ribonuclease HI family protein [Candidatus Paceibacterota bacterium]
MKKIIIYTDGASRGNPGKGSAGFLFCNEKGQVIKKYSQYLGDKITNNEAEYTALILALKKFKAVFGKQLAKTAEVEVKSDSELMVKQLCGEYKIIEPNIQQLFLEIWNLRIDFGRMKFKLIPREKNKEADKLANEALDTQSQGFLV